MALSPGSRTGVAAILAGVLYFAGQAGQLAFGNALNPLWVAMVVLVVRSSMASVLLLIRPRQRQPLDRSPR